MLLGGELQIDFKNSNFEILERACLYEENGADDRRIRKIKLMSMMLKTEVDYEYDEHVLNCKMIIMVPF